MCIKRSGKPYSNIEFFIFSNPILLPKNVLDSLKKGCFNKKELKIPNWSRRIVGQPYLNELTL